MEIFGGDIRRDNGQYWSDYFSSHFPSCCTLDLIIEIEFYLVQTFTRSHKLGLVGAGGGKGWDWIECLHTHELLCPSLLTCSHIYTYCSVIILGDT